MKNTLSLVLIACSGMLMAQEKVFVTMHGEKVKIKTTTATPWNKAGTTTTAATTNTENIYQMGKVGVKTYTPHASAALEVKSTTEGFLPPRMTTTQRNAIASPATGLIIYNESTRTPEFFNGTAWSSYMTEPPVIPPTQPDVATADGRIWKRWNVGATAPALQYNNDEVSMRVTVSELNTACGTGYRVPTVEEFMNMLTLERIHSTQTAFSSKLRLTMGTSMSAGYYHCTDGYVRLHPEVTGPGSIIGVTSAPTSSGYFLRCIKN